MKKIFVPLALVLSVSFSSAAFAAATFTSAGPGAAPPTVSGVMANVRTSTNVTLVCNSGTSQYAAAAAHAQGTRTFGSTSGSASIFWRGKDAGTPIDATAIPNGDSDTAQFDSWTSL